jgi:hypothetical protein
MRGVPADPIGGIGVIRCKRLKFRTFACRSGRAECECQSKPWAGAGLLGQRPSGQDFVAEPIDVSQRSSGGVPHVVGLVAAAET